MIKNIFTSFEEINVDELKEKTKKYRSLKKHSSELNEEQKQEYEDVKKYLSKIRKQISKKVYQLDKKNNRIKVNILLNENNQNKLQDDLESINNVSTIEKKIETDQKELDLLKNKIQTKKVEKTDYGFDLFEFNNKRLELKKDQNKLFKIQTSDPSVLQEKINSFEKVISKHQLSIDEIQKEIENQLHLIKLIDKAYEMKDNSFEGDNAFVVRNLNVFYGSKQALFDINIDLPKNKVISIIGPSGCGKSTFLRTLNRINDEIPNFHAEGQILLDAEYDIYKLRSIINRNNKMEITELRTKVGMIFQQPNPFPMSIYKNVSFGPRINGIKNKSILNDLVETSLKDAALWDEVSNNLSALGTSLSGGQQQRLCIARAIANKPEILLMDEPTSALDPIAASKIENLILKLKKDYTIIIVTHSMQQAARISDYTAFFYAGKLIEFDETQKLFSNPVDSKTDDYIRGKFG